MAPDVAALNRLILRLEVSHVVFGGLCFGLYCTALASEQSGQPPVVPVKLLFFLLASFTMLAVSVPMFLACLLERLAEEDEKPYKSLFEVALYCLGCFLYFIATISLIIYLVEDDGVETWTLKKASFIGAAMFASWNTITYLISLWAFVKLHSNVRLEVKVVDSAPLIG